jgi:AbiTii-like protein
MFAMSSRAIGLLAQIEAGVLDDSVPLSTLLQKVIVLGGKAGSEKMREWARRELNGYVGSGVVLPDYRRIPSALYVRITNRVGYNAISQRISPSELPDFMTDDVDVEEAALGNSVGELEAIAAKGDEDGKPHFLSPSWGSILVDFLNKHAVMDGMSVVVAAYWEVSNASIKGLLVRVRAALAELVAELASLTPAGQEVPTQAAADQAIQFVITGERPTINVTSQHTNSGPNISAPGAQSAVLATGNGTAIGSQTASGENSTAVGSQAAHGEDATITGRDSTATVTSGEKAGGWWARLRKRGVFVAFFTVIGGIAGVIAAIVAVLSWIGWVPW